MTLFLCEHALAKFVLADGENKLKLIFSDGEAEVNIVVTDTEKKEDPKDDPSKKPSVNNDGKESKSDDTPVVTPYNIPQTGDYFAGWFVLLLMPALCAAILVLFTSKKKNN